MQQYPDGIDRRLSVAPMMDWTDRHCRVFHRAIAPDAFLFTEMVTAEAILHGNLDRLLGHDLADQPVALQLGGSQPERLADATRIAADWGYQEVNLNVGCPSDRVQSGRFGACLMAEPNLVAECVAAMQAVTSVPVTVKCRIGIDDMDEETGLDHFVDTVSAAGTSIFYLHARKAWLNGLSPKENRDIPPLNYDRARRLAARRPDLAVHLNGGLDQADVTIEAMTGFAGVMLGRAAYKNPMILAEIGAHLFAQNAPARQAIAETMAEYADRMTATGTPLHTITRHMLGLYAGQRGAKHWRRRLGEEARLSTGGGQLIRDAASECEALAAEWAA